jgi:hypothetical protein
MYMKRNVLICLGLIAIAGSSYAEVTVKEYREIKAANAQDWRDMKVYLVGVEEGFSWANVFEKSNHGLQMYCPPPKLHFTADIDISIIDDEIERQKHGSPLLTDADKLEPLFLFGLVHTYPCK